MQATNVLCDGCGQPIDADEIEGSLVRVGSCEFPFHLHSACRAQMGSALETIAEWCEFNTDQPPSASAVSALSELLNLSTPGRGR